MRYGTITIILLLVFPAVGISRSIHVPGDYGTIQQAIDSAAAGDSVLVAPGIYLEKIDFSGKAIALLSTHGATVTIIDGNLTGSVVTFQNGEGPGSIIEGFTIRNGKTYYFGGGIFCKGSSPIISGNRIVSCISTSSGGGIGCTEKAEPLVVCNTICKNLAVSGGGMYSSDSSPVLFNNIICDNTVIPGTSFSFGAGIRFHSSSSLIMNNTIVDNTATGNGLGGGIDSWNSELDIVNTIIWNNEAPTGPSMSLAGLTGNPATLSIRYSDVEGGQNAIYMGSGVILDWGASMIDADPLFAQASAGDYHLLYTSPCRDSGDGVSPNLPVLDFEGDPRVTSGVVDMGADEFSTRLYWIGDGTPGGAVQVKVVSQPFKTVLLLLGQDVLDPSLPTRFGYLHLQLPVSALFMGTLPMKGLVGIKGRIPPGYPAPSSLPMQALVRFMLTNLCVMEIQ